MMLSDNQEVMNIANDSAFHERTKHTEVDYPLIQRNRVGQEDSHFVSYFQELNW